MKIILFSILVLLLAAFNHTGTNNTATKNITVAIQNSAFKSANVNEHVIYGRAFNAVIWGMLAVNYQAWLSDKLRITNKDSRIH